MLVTYFDEKGEKIGIGVVQDDVPRFGDRVVATQDAPRLIVVGILWLPYIVPPMVNIRLVDEETWRGLQLNNQLPGWDDVLGKISREGE